MERAPGGKVTATQHHIDLQPDTRPTGKPLIVQAISSRVLIKQEIERMLLQGVIEPAMSDWASPVVIVPKKDGSALFCVDYRSSTQAQSVTHTPIPRMDDCIDSLGGSQDLHYARLQ